ncbi:hypothetical protein AL036_00620 [Salipiger aestuarii]|nr:hypothetical protein AL036_00620 [Salipiger aestuarii]KAA8616436.1 hypothetical protein AL037_00615 [Salipiger aestuarii]
MTTQGTGDVARWAGAAIIAAVFASGIPAAATDVSYSFVWQGGNGHEMRGAMSFDSALMTAPEVYARDLSCFVIEGTHNGTPIGRWALGMLNEQTTWALTFLPQDAAFAVFGPRHMMPQAWNMDGFGTDCGASGFGFNIGNAAQDLCVDGRLVLGSQVAPDQPFPATPDPSVRFPADACPRPDLIGALDFRALRGAGAASR